VRSGESVCLYLYLLMEQGPGRLSISVLSNGACVRSGEGVLTAGAPLVHAATLEVCMHRLRANVIFAMRPEGPWILTLYSMPPFLDSPKKTLLSSLIVRVQYAR